MDWLVFGDDWGRHPSTTQHLVKSLPGEDRVVWVNSLGMRSPNLTKHDLRRAVQKAATFSGRVSRIRERDVHSPRTDMCVIEPAVLPFHHLPSLRRLNSALLSRQIRRALQELGCERPAALVTNPMAAYYLDALPLSCVSYLRLDEMPDMPGVDAALCRDAERRMAARSEVGFVTARNLLPEGAQLGHGWHYLPQGVDVTHFAHAPLSPPESRVLGFFGLLAEWIDFDLIEAVAHGAPDWTLEFVGPSQYFPAHVRELPNVRLRGPVAYQALPAETQHWRAAWLPFVTSRLTQGINPLKVREYLAAGLPTLSTPMPEVMGLPHVRTTKDAAEVLAWLRGEATHDDAEQRLARRRSVHCDDWSSRAATLRSEVAAACTRVSREAA